MIYLKRAQRLMYNHIKKVPCFISQYTITAVQPEPQITLPGLAYLNNIPYQNKILIIRSDIIAKLRQRDKK